MLKRLTPSTITLIVLMIPIAEYWYLTCLIKAFSLANARFAIGFFVLDTSLFPSAIVCLLALALGFIIFLKLKIQAQIQTWIKAWAIVVVLAYMSVLLFYLLNAGFLER